MTVYTYFDKDENTPIYYVTPDSQSSHPESTFESETETSVSALTIDSVRISDYFVQHHGRQHIVNESAIRWHPSDNIKRYIIWHLDNLMLLGGHYSGPVKEILAPVPGRQRRVLELGTRLGTWTQEMATEFLHVQFRSVDLAPIIGHTPRANIEFEVFDFSKELLLEDNSQDAVFLNLVGEMVIDYRAVLREAHRVLCPGGLIHIIEFNLRIWDSQDMTKEAWHTNPMTCQLAKLVRAQLTRMGADPTVSDKISEWLAPESELWEHNRDAGGFERIESTARMRPLYPHEGHECMDRMDPQLAPYIRHLSVTSLGDQFGILRDGGMEAKDAETLIEKVIEEIKDPKGCALLKKQCIHAIKRGGV